MVDEALNGYGGLGIERVVVNGTRQSDWPLVAALAARWAIVKPSFGLHPWFVNELGEGWKDALTGYWESDQAAVGEIGLDRWIEGFDIEAQKEAFLWQLRFATAANLPVSIHCLRAWGLLYDLLKRESLPRRGFLLHSYGGPMEMVEPLAKLGAYFSVSGYFAHARKGGARDAFRKVPIERLLIETDAPDMLGPSRVMHEKINDDEGKAVNHPFNLVRIYAFVAEMLGRSEEDLVDRIGENFRRFFD